MTTPAQNAKFIRRVAALTTLLLLALTGAYAGAEENQNRIDRIRHQKVLRLYFDYRKAFVQVPEIAAADAILLLNKSDVIFVDVRKPKEQAVSMIPGAISEKDFLDEINQYRDKTIIAYCTISYRSGKLAKRLNRKGYDVTNLQAGLLGWIHAGGPLIQNGRPVKRLHVYGRKWDLAPSDYHTVY